MTGRIPLETDNTLWYRFRMIGLRTTVWIAVSAALLSGCGTYRQPGPPRFDVDVSFLDYVTFTYHETGRATPGSAPTLERTTLSGSGHIHYARGRSSRVHTSFWTEGEEEHVQDLFTDQLVIGSDQVKEIFQSLVDAGVFERSMHGNRIQNVSNEYVIISSKINERRGIVITDDPKFVGIYKKLVGYLHR